MRKEKWLIVYVGCVQGESKMVEGCIKAATGAIMKPVPDFCSESIPRSVTEQIMADTKTSSEFLYESIQEHIINRIVEWRTNIKASQIAVVLPYKAFSTQHVFDAILKNKYFKDSGYSAICFKYNFFEGFKAQCIDAECSGCTNVGGCDHSCFVKLIWKMFHKNDDVVSFAEKWASEYLKRPDWDE